MECVELAPAFEPPPPYDSASKLDALHTLRAAAHPQELRRAGERPGATPTRRSTRQKPATSHFSGNVTAEKGFGGVRSSSDAATTDHADVLDFTTSPPLSDTAAPETGALRQHRPRRH